MREVKLVPLQPEDREQFILDGEKVGGVVLQIDRNAAKGELELLFDLPECHSKGAVREK